MLFENIQKYTPCLRSIPTLEELRNNIERRCNTQQDDLFVYKVEKDFWLTVILDIISRNFPELVFKGGTCLNKVYYPQFRMSEDLDFVYYNIYNKNTNSRTVRNDILNDCLERLSFMEDIGCFILNSRWENGKLEFKHNACSNAILTYGYKSIIDGSQQTIKIDIIIGPSIIEEPVVQSLTSLLNEYFYEINIPCLTLKEIYSEKLTAALCRKTPAIRDYYDIWYAINSGFDFYEDSFLKLFTHKIQEDKFNYSFNKEWVEELLNKQIEMDLRPVLFNPNGADFNLSAIRNIVAQFYIDPALVETNTEE